MSGEFYTGHRRLSRQRLTMTAARFEDGSLSFTHYLEAEPLRWMNHKEEEKPTDKSAPTSTPEIVVYKANEPAAAAD